MTTEDYVSFETAKLLKEKGFNIQYWKYYSPDTFGPKMFHTQRKGNSQLIPEWEECVCPTLQMAMKWLREKHKITIGILFKGDRIYYEIHQNNEFVFGIDSPESYEKVCDEAIRYCLKILVKND